MNVNIVTSVSTVTEFYRETPLCLFVVGLEPDPDSVGRQCGITWHDRTSETHPLTANIGVRPDSNLFGIVTDIVVMALTRGASMGISGRL